MSLRFFNLRSIAFVLAFLEQFLLHEGEQEWCSSESVRLPPIWPGFDSALMICGSSLLLVLALLISEFQFDQDRGPGGKPFKTDVASSLLQIVNQIAKPP